MKKRNILPMLFGSVLLAACTSDITPEEKQNPIFGYSDINEPIPVLFSVSEQHDFTRSATSVVTFNDDEEIKVFVKPDDSDTYTDYIYTTDTETPAQTNVSLTPPAEPPYFPAGSGTTVDAYAYYPASGTMYSTEGSNTIFTVASNQTDPDDYKASDLMYAANRTITKGSSAGTDLLMAHKMVQLKITAAAQTGSGLTIHKVKVNAKNSVIFAPNTTTVTSTQDAKADITALTAAGTGYICIPVQKINDITIKIETDAAGSADKTAEFSFTSADEFVAGCSYPINLTINTSQLGLATAISDWNGMASVNYTPTGDLAIVVDNSYDLTYSGSRKEPPLNVTKDGVPLVKDATNGYDVEWFNNINAGSAIAIVKGKGTNVSSVGVINFNITPKPLEESMVGNLDGSYIYNRTAQELVPTVLDGSALTRGKDFTVAWDNNINAGEHTATITGEGNYSGTIERGFTISPKSINTFNLTLNQTATTYTGDIITASVVSLNDGDYTLTEGEYIIADGSVTTATDAAISAEAEITQNTITVNGVANYTGSVSKQWSIARAEGAITSFSPSSLTLTKAYSTGVINVVREGTGAITAVSSDTEVATASVSGTNITVNAVEGGAAEILIKVEADKNHLAYNAEDNKVSITVSGFQDIKMNPLWWVAEYNLNSDMSSFDKTLSTSQGAHIKWNNMIASNFSYTKVATADGTSYDGWKTFPSSSNTNRTIEGVVWHMGTQQEFSSIFPGGSGDADNGSSNLFTSEYLKNANVNNPYESDISTEQICVFGYDATTRGSTLVPKSYWSSFETGQFVRYAIRFIGTKYCSAWRYEVLDPAVYNSMRIVVTAKLITKINTNNPGALAAEMKKMTGGDANYWSSSRLSSEYGLSRTFYCCGHLSSGADDGHAPGTSRMLTSDQSGYYLNATSTKQILYIGGPSSGDIHYYTHDGTWPMSIRLFRDN